MIRAIGYFVTAGIFTYGWITRSFDAMFITVALLLWLDWADELKKEKVR